MLALPALFGLVFFAYPLLNILRFSLWDDSGFNASGFLRLASTRYYLETIAFSFWQATLSTLLTLALAVPSAWVFVRYQFRFRRILLALSSLPFVLPTVVVAMALQTLLGNQGVVNQALMRAFNLAQAPIQLERTLGFILIAHVFYNYAVALRLIVGYWANQSARIEEAAQVLGAQGWQVWWYIRLPLLRPVLLASALLVFIFTFTSFGVVLILGGIRFATLEVQIYYQALSVFNLPMAAALSLVQLGVMGAMMWLYTRLQRQNARDLQATATLLRVPRRWYERFIVSLVSAFVVVLLFAPLGVLLWSSLTYAQDAPTLRYYALLGENTRMSALFVSAWVSVGYSLLYAFITTCLALILGVAAAFLIQKFPLADALFMLPLATSAVTLGFGYILSFGAWRSAWWLVPVAHTLVALPFVLRSVLPSLRSIPPSLDEAGRVLGASPRQRLSGLTLPLIGRGMAVGAVFSFTVSMGEFGASLFLARPNMPTIPMTIFRLLGQPARDNYGQALAMSVILLALCAVSFLLIERLREAGTGEF
jgi:thiamine transport system permease protein